ncbi:alpha/beta fold hydrolase [Streptomyces sp. NPDC087440]|uniref:alpha/beta fold hydrolase n=1 Tax=Streptomyces sp. NPDC087440 TaxID=3365790 RepID=UPI0037F89F5D
MATYVLVAGAWLGAWVWDEVAEGLRAAGHAAHPLTLTGLAEKQGRPAGQQTHVQDIVDEVERLDLRDVVLVGHSYSGIPVGQAAERIGDRLACVVFVDSNVPEDGKAFAADAPSPHRARLVKSLEENGGCWPCLTADDCEGQGMTDDQVARFLDGSTPHPGDSLLEPAVLKRPVGELPATYVKCLLDGEELMEEVAKALESEHWELVWMDTGHWPMFSQPDELIRVLLDAHRP